jgi:hypothetical protein
MMSQPKKSPAYEQIENIINAWLAAARRDFYL